MSLGDFIGNVWNGVTHGVTTVASFPVNLAGNGTVLVRTATNKFKEASSDAVKELFTAVLERIPEVIHQLSPSLLLNTANELLQAVINALIRQVGGLATIQNAITSNEINRATLALIWRDGAELVKFLVGELEPIKCDIMADSNAGVPHGPDNELDLSDAMNRHAVICQIQRLVQSVVFIFSHMTQRAIGAIDITQETTLLSDHGMPNNITVAPAIPPGAPVMPAENWFFVNGIAGELCWLQLACRKLANTYGRAITGVFNRGDGIFWDLVECAGERSQHGPDRSASQGRLIQRTASSILAQATLRDRLEQALNTDGSGSIVIVAHSQGCLVLRLALGDLVLGQTPLLLGADPQAHIQFRERMRRRLQVFTFANPSVDWKVETNTTPLASQAGVDMSHLSSHVHHTEHFANEEDFVAGLGVLSPNRPLNSGYSNIFINRQRAWTGHLFGAQYSLGPNDYVDVHGQPNGQNSHLLSCVPGQPI